MEGILRKAYLALVQDSLDCFVFNYREGNVSYQDLSSKAGVTEGLNTISL